MKRNVCYLITAILNIFGAVSNFISVIIMFLLGSSIFAELFEYDSSVVYGDASAMAMEMTIMNVVYYVSLGLSLLTIAICIFSAVKFFKFSALNEKSSSVILWTVLNFVFCGLLCGILAVVGYATCEEKKVVQTSQQTAQPQTMLNGEAQPKTYANIDQLRDLQRLRKEQLITDEEYEKMRIRIISGNSIDRATLNSSDNNSKLNSSDDGNNGDFN